MFRRKTFWKHNIFATLFVFAVMVMASKASHIKLFDAFNPIEETLSDIEITDIVFSHIRKDPVPDTNIVLINIGNLSRGQIGRELEIVRRYEPLAVGLDVFFFNPKDSLEDNYLAEQLQQTKNAVLVSRLEKDSTGEFTRLHGSHPMFTTGLVTGFANLNTSADYQEDFKTCRKFPVRRTVGNMDQRAFALELARMKSPEKANRLLLRNNEFEQINYRGNIADYYNNTNYNVSFYALDADEVLNEAFDPSVIRGKIVLFGYLGQNFRDTSWDDRFYTPLNKKYAGKTNPDMYGVVVHANIISMILHENYISSFDDTDYSGFWLALLICFLNISLFSFIHFRYTKYYDLLTKFFQVLEVILFLYISILALNYINLKLGLTITITAIILSGDLLEIYYSLIIRILRRISKKAKQWLRLYPVLVRGLRHRLAGQTYGPQLPVTEEKN